MPGYSYVDENADTGEGSGSVWNNLIESATKLGTVALTTYAPKNAGLATTPQGEAAVGIRGLGVAAPSSTISWLLVAGVVVVGYLAFTRL